MAKIPKTLAPVSRAVQGRAQQPGRLSWNRLHAFTSFILIVLLASPGFRDSQIPFTPGQPLQESVVAPFDLTIVDTAALEKRLDEIDAKQFVKVDAAVRSRGIERMESIIQKARTAYEQYQETKDFEQVPAYDELVKALRDAGYAEEQAQKDAQSMARRGVSDKLANEMKELLRELYDERGTAAPVPLARIKAHAANDTVVWTTDSSLPRQEFDERDILEAPGDIGPHLRRVLPARHAGDSESRGVVERMVTALAEPVLVLDSETKATRLKEAQENAPQRIYRKNDLVAAAGTIVDDEQADILGQFQERQRWYRAVTTLGIAAFVALLFTLITLYLKKFPGEMPNTPSNVILISLPIIFAFAFWRVLQYFGIPALAGYGFPAALVGMLAVVLLGPRLAWLLVTCAGLLFGVASGFQFSYTLVALFGGYTAITTLYSTRTRWDILTSAGIVSLVNAVVILAISFIENPSELSRDTARAVAYGVTNGLICGALVFPMLWLFERMFGVVTDFALLELTGTIHPLMRELEEKASGSYQHTLNVTKLAEAAAREIGANYLLVRAGGYFHDIGKIEKPRYFSENQMSQDDRSLHSKLSPFMSTLIIKNHVKEGIEMAKRQRGRYKVPREVIDFIPEHQGTTLISFFHRQALRQFQETETTDPVNEVDFRYPGPKPQSIETAIVMLADSVEATVTSIFTASTVNEDELRRVVRKSIHEKFDDGQFDECDLTLRDLHIISESFIKTLKGRFHRRVQYPDAPKPGTTSIGVRRVGAPLTPTKPEAAVGR